MTTKARTLHQIALAYAGWSERCEAESNALIETLYLMSGSGSEAFRYFEAARELFEVLGENLNLGMVYQNLGALHWKWGDRQDAHDYWYRALELYRRLDYQQGVNDVEYELFKSK